MKQVGIVETIKEKSMYNKKLKFLKKNHYDNQRAMNRTTDGNSFSRYKKDMNYWFEKIKEFEAVRFTIGKIQDEIIKTFSEAELKRIECKICHGDGQLPAYQGEGEEREIIDYIDCICTDDRWDPENQDRNLDD